MNRSLTPASENQSGGQGSDKKDSSVHKDSNADDSSKEKEKDKEKNGEKDKDKKCSTNGQRKCNGKGFQTCDHGTWVNQDCSQGTECRPENGSVVCDHPSNKDKYLC